jgi:hypothetical protein
MSDEYRQASLLDRIYQSKAYGGYRRVMNTFADGFKNTDGVGSLTGGSVNTGSGYVQATAAATISSNNPTSSASGLQTLTIMDRSWTLLNGATYAKFGVYMTAAGSVTLKVVQRNSAGNYTVINAQTFSHPGGGFVDFTLTTPYAVPASGNFYVAAYVPVVALDYQSGAPLAFIAGDAAVGSTSGSWTEQTGTAPSLRATTLPAISLTTGLQPTDSAVSNGRVLMEFDNSAAPVLNTDLTAEVTCNGGTNWVAAALAAVTSNSQTGRKVAETADQACTSGSLFAARIKTPTGKLVPLYGLSVAVH